MRCFVIMFFVLCFIITSPGTGNATPFTPLEWQRSVLEASDGPFIGQRKHTTWVRDQNRNFIDDVIDRRMEEEPSFDVIIDLNTCLTIKEINRRFDKKKGEGYGHVTYVGKMITFIYLDGVRAGDLFRIARMDTVAMIEIQPEVQPALDTSTRAVQARACQSWPYVGKSSYVGKSAEDSGFTGSNINIAIIDTGVDDDHEQMEFKFVAGFDATAFEDLDHDNVDDSQLEPADGTKNPDDDWGFAGSQGHGTLVAGIALGKGVDGRDCRQPNNEKGSCAGVAPEAGLVDIRVFKAGRQESVDVAEALDWLGLNFNRIGIDVRVANISLTLAVGKDKSGCLIWDDDGTSAHAQQVNYLSALGIVMVAAHGNAVPNFQDGDRITHSPGSASFAVTVSGTTDMSTVTRDDDKEYKRHLVGPRHDFEQNHDILALKPDISAPGQGRELPSYLEGIRSAKYNTKYDYWMNSGTSLAAPHVSGAAALILQANPRMNPGSVKDALKRSADNSKNQKEFAIIHPDWNWDKALGWGMLNVRAAIDLLSATDVGFPTCSGPANHSGDPCTLAGGLPSWNNNQDISTSASPQVGVEIQILARVKNSGTKDARALVNFGVYIFAVGNNRFFHIGTKEVDISAGSTQTVTHPWKPESEDHQCIQVSIDYGSDTNFDNNVTERKLQVSPSDFTLRVENPFSVPAEFLVQPKSQRKGWHCGIDDATFSLHPYLDPPKNVQITFDAPKDALPGERADCDVAVLAKPRGSTEFHIIGGVTVQTFVPKPCRIIGWIRDKEGGPVERAKLIMRSNQQVIEAESDRYGFVSFEGIPYVKQKISVVSDKYGNQSSKEPVALYCGAGTFEILVTEKGLVIESNRRNKDWAWDSQVKEGYESKRKK